MERKRGGWNFRRPTEHQRLAPRSQTTSETFPYTFLKQVRLSLRNTGHFTASDRNVVTLLSKTFDDASAIQLTPLERTSSTSKSVLQPNSCPADVPAFPTQSYSVDNSRLNSPDSGFYLSSVLKSAPQRLFARNNVVDLGVVNVIFFFPEKAPVTSPL